MKFIPITKENQKIFDVFEQDYEAEFYILPCYKKLNYRKNLASMFDTFLGKWQVRQVLAAEGAIAFWRSIINEYTHGNYVEDEITDPHWGHVLRQCFDRLRK